MAPSNDVDTALKQMSDCITTILTDVATSAQALEQNSKEEVEAVDNITQGVAMNAVVLQRALAISSRVGLDEQEKIAALKDLDAKRKAGNMPFEELKDCDAYKDFAGQFGEVGDDDDIVCANEAVPTVDPFSAAPLARDADSKRWPVALKCKHVYNWSTIVAKRPNGKWALEKCAKSGCANPDQIPTTLKERHTLKEDSRVKHALEKKARKVRESVDGAVELED